MPYSKKSSLILVLKILQEYTDEEHFLTQKDIADKIYQIYGLELERKTIGNNISILEELEYDITKAPGGGFALFQRTFEKSEVSFLVDALFSSKSLSASQAKRLSNKVSGCLSKYSRKKYDNLYKSSDLNKSTNKDIFLNIEIINDAIKQNKWIGFKYLEYDGDGKESLRYNGYVYHASPCYLINSFGRYYFLGYRLKYNSVTTFRLDYMKDVQIFDERERIDPTTLDEFKGYDSITDYINEHIYMFGGDVIDVTFKLSGPKTVQYVKDWFGHNAHIYKKNDSLMANVKCNELAFFYWAMQYGQYITIVSPESMIQKVKDAAKNILNLYENKE